MLCVFVQFFIDELPGVFKFFQDSFLQGGGIPCFRQIDAQAGNDFSVFKNGDRNSYNPGFGNLGCQLFFPDFLQFQQ